MPAGLSAPRAGWLRPRWVAQREGGQRVEGSNLRRGRAIKDSATVRHPRLSPNHRYPSHSQTGGALPDDISE